MRELNNKLIAEFMELEMEVSNKGVVEYYHEEFDSGEWYEAEDLPYDEWNWIMPVVDKIECTPIDNDDNSDNFFNVMIEVFECNINGGGICICESGHTKRDATYKAVVEFIKWYNNQSK